MYILLINHNFFLFMQNEKVVKMKKVGTDKRKLQNFLCCDEVNELITCHSLAGKGQHVVEMDYCELIFSLSMLSILRFKWNFLKNTLKIMTFR